MNLNFDSQKTRVMKSFLFIVLAVSIGFTSQQVMRAQTPSAPDEKRAISQKNVVESSPCTPLILWPGRSVSVTGKKGWRLRILPGLTAVVTLVSLVAILSPALKVTGSAAIVDLGTADELSARVGFEDAQGGGTGFASIHLQGDKVMVLKQDLGKQEFQPLQELSKLSELGSPVAAPIKLGHIYLVRITGKKDNSNQQFVKLMVIAFRPHEAVTLRWELL